MSRWKAVSIHLLISATAGVAVAALVHLWYPPPYAHALGAGKLLVLLLGGLAVGPILTAVIWKVGKRGLFSDLVTIALVQCVALAYGLTITALARPVFVVGAVDRFVVVSAGDIDDRELARAPVEFRSLSWSGPRLVGTRIPDAVAERNSILFSAINGRDIEKYPQYYVDYSTVATEFLARAKSIDDLAEADARALRDIPAATQGQFEWLPIVARKANAVMLLDAKSGMPLGAVAANPW